MFDRTRVESETAPYGYFINCSNDGSELSRGARVVPRQSRHLWTKMHTLILAALAAVATAMPSYIAVPADQIAFVDLSALRVRRVPRQTLSPPPPPPQLPLPQLPQAFYEQEYPTTLQQYQQQRLTPVPVPVQIQVQENEAPARLVRLQQQPQQQLQQQPQQQLQQQLQLQPQPQDSIGSTTFGAASQFAERPPDFGEYVDFGAHTGDHGSFGWYADYPVNNHQDSSYRK
ncbi:uncharacterized protein LOC118272061 isoform X2 [Spodoptera frugiperda]|uniref:Uncharacterized protein LOC118272061 isoform X2 n=1 Tax=Spodoptera frugiperda TaxID=7108 RepID=A0A9R0ETT9_SPOFR|nr:uncharacterized protein LOC118272061 isoform X2 [Spodoptera frugiperda]